MRLQSATSGCIAFRLRGKTAHERRDRGPLRGNFPRTSMRGNMVLPTPLQAFSGMPKASATTEKQTIVDGEKMTGAEALVRSLEDLGVKDVFGVPGGAILPVYDSIKDDTKFRFVHDASRAGRRTCGRRLRADHRTGGRVHRHLRSGRHQHDHPDRRSNMDPFLWSSSPARSA